MWSRQQLDPPDVAETFKVRKRKCATYLYDAVRVQAAELRVANAERRHLNDPD
jgi:hypothetical protein